MLAVEQKFRKKGIGMGIHKNRKKAGHEIRHENDRNESRLNRPRD